MKSISYFIILALSAVMTLQVANAEEKAMIVYLKSGEAVQYRLSDVDSIVYDKYRTYLNGYEYVDLGLSVKWATCNVGAQSSEEAGYYIAWGDTVGYVDFEVDERAFTWDTYKYSKGSNQTLTKYCDRQEYGCVAVEATDSTEAVRYTDELSSLVADDDAALRYMGEGWRIPTRREMIELKNKCYWEWTNSYAGTGVNGYIVYRAKAEGDKGKFSYDKPVLDAEYTLNDTHIFLPAAGYRRGEGGVNTTNFNKAGVWSYGKMGNYWSSDLRANEPYKAYYHNFSETTGRNEIGIAERYMGRSVRAVCDVADVAEE